MAESRKREMKVCGVCGDHALGSNFNAITCESCKAFFRRNALKKKDFKCPFENCCKVDVITRRFCQRCRLKKCFEIGMKKEWIMTEDQKKAKKTKIEKNRQKKKGQEHSKKKDFIEVTVIKVESPDPSLNNVLLSPSSSLSPLTPQTPGNAGIVAEPQRARLFVQPLTPDYEYSPPTKISVIEEAEDNQLEAVVCETEESANVHLSAGPLSPVKLKDSNNIELKKDRKVLKKAVVSPLQNSSITCSILKEGDSSQDCTDDIEKAKTKLPNFGNCSSTVLPDDVFNKAVAIEFTELPIRSAKLRDSRELSPLELAKLDELVIANAVLKMPLACGINDPSLLDVINMTDHAIRRLIKMSKKIVCFKNLCQNDQIALLKGGCTELMILRSVMSYDPEKDCWRGPQGPKRMSIKVDILKEAKGNVYEEHKRFINSFEPHWRTDENIMLILSGIALFTPERPNIIHKDVIKLEQETYYYLLRRYLESIYSACEARSSYLKLIHRIQELHILNENHVRVYLDVNPKDVEPLLIEIFDLTH